MRTKNILLVEDDYVDVTSVKRTLAKLNVKHNLHVAHNGVDALAILNGDSTGSKLLPDIILLDLNMPKMNGLEFLSIIKNYYSLKNIKVFVMTTSAEEYDIVATQQLGVHGYILKPLDFDKIKNDRYSVAVKSLKEELLSDNTKMYLPLLFPAAGQAWAGWKAKLVVLKKGAAALHYFGTAKIATLSVAAITTVVAMAPVLVKEPAPGTEKTEIRQNELPSLARLDTVAAVKPMPVIEQIPEMVPRKKRAKITVAPEEVLPAPIIQPHSIKIAVVAEEEEAGEGSTEGDGAAEETTAADARSETGQQ